MAHASPEQKETTPDITGGRQEMSSELIEHVRDRGAHLTQKNVSLNLLNATSSEIEEFRKAGVLRERVRAFTPTGSVSVLKDAAASENKIATFQPGSTVESDLNGSNAQAHADVETITVENRNGAVAETLDPKNEVFTKKLASALSGGKVKEVNIDLTRVRNAGTKLTDKNAA